MSERQRKGRVAAILGGALTLTLPLAAQMAHADQKVLVTVANGYFTQPELGGARWDGATPAHWEGDGRTVSREAAQHPGEIQAATLGALSTTLRDVKAGARMTVLYEVSPTTRPGCSADAREFTIGVGSLKADRTTERAPGDRKPNWKEQSFPFTAKENAPTVTFAGKGDAACGPMLANVRAYRDDPPGDADPCAGDKPGTACGGAREKDPCKTSEGSEKPQACGGVTDNQSEMQRCKPKITTDNSCLDEVATDGRREKDLINGQETKIGKFNDRKRESDPARAVDDACSTPLSGLPPFKKDHYVFLPTGCEPSP
ncbi:hypothetical protein WEB32_30175 [Streptomyces netropsis]|uniref:hypothetical protein n=1 Tax=Streptomyces netropsis TaxID=55404 RepID=UPI0030CE6A19